MKITRGGIKLIRHKILYSSITLCLFLCVCFLGMKIFGAEPDPFLGHTYTASEFNAFTNLTKTNWETGTVEANASDIPAGDAVVTKSTETIDGKTLTKYIVHSGTKIISDQLYTNSNVIIEGGSDDYNDVVFERASDNVKPIFNFYNSGATMTVYLRNITLDGKEISTNKDIGAVTINSSSGKLATNLYVTNCAFINNKTKTGAAIYAGAYPSGEGADVGSINLTDCYFYNNKSTANHGGAIYDLYAPLNINNCTFDSNFAHYSGGAIECENPSAVLTITNSTFINNSCNNNGGAIFYRSGNLNITGTTFKNNSTVRYSGGAIYTEKKGNATIDNCIFEGNIARTNEAEGTSGQGGAIVFDSDTADDVFTITYSKFNDNKGVIGGCIVGTTNVIINVSNTEFKDNSASQGGVYAGAAEVTFDTCDFINNESGSTGGAIFSQDRPLKVIGCNFTNNKTTNYGGAICAVYNDIDVSGCDFNKSFAGYRGGAIYTFLGKKSNYEISDSTFSENDSKMGIDLFFEEGVHNDASNNYDSTYNVTDCEFIGKESEIAENASIYISSVQYMSGAYGTTNSVFTFDNIKMHGYKNLGGGPLEIEGRYVDDYASSVIVKNSEFYDNEDSFAGGAISAYGVDLTVDSCEIYNNSAYGFGGGITAYDLNEFVINDSYIHDNKAPLGGAIYGNNITLKGDTRIPFNADGKYNTKDNYYNDIYYIEQNVVENTLNGATNLSSYNKYVPLIFDEFNSEIMKNNNEIIRLDLVTGAPGFMVSKSSQDKDLSISDFYDVIELAHTDPNFEYENFDLDDASNRNYYSGDILKESNYKILKDDSNSSEIKYYLLRDLNLFKDLTLNNNTYDGTEKFLNQAKLNIYNDFFDYEKYDTGDPSWVPTGIDNTSDLIDLNEVDVTYENNIDAGKVIAHVKAKDTSTKYSGEVDLTYDIVCNLPSDTNAKVINDGDKKVVYAGGRIIEEGTDYEVVSQDDTSITVNGISPYYQGTHTFTLSSLPSDIEFIDTCEFNDTTNDKVYKVKINDMKNKTLYNLASITDPISIKADLSTQALNTTTQSKVNDLTDRNTITIPLKVMAKQFNGGTYLEDVPLKNDTVIDFEMARDSKYNYTNIKGIYVSLDESDVVNLTPISSNVSEVKVNASFKIPCEGIILIQYDMNLIPVTPPGGGGGGGGSHDVPKPATTQTFTYQNVIHNALLEGYDDGEFKPERNLTREEVATIIARLSSDYNANYDYTEYISWANDYIEGYWSNNYTGYMLSKGYMTLNENDNYHFNGREPITRGELAIVLVKAKNLKLKENSTFNINLKDIVGKSYEEDVKILISNGYIDGFEDGTFRGEKYLRRCEMCKLICFMEDRVINNTELVTLEMKESLKEKYNDLVVNEWYMPYVYELTVKHDYSLLHK